MVGYGILNAMKRSFFLIFLLLCLSFPAQIFAQDNVPMRVSARDDYARAVFGWSENVDYTLSRDQDGLLTLQFKSAAQLDLSQGDVSGIANIFDIKVMAQDPLTIEIRIPESSKVRDFKIGKRVVLDIYNPQNNSELKPKAPDAQKKAEAQPVEKSKVKPSLPAVPPAIVLVPEYVPESSDGKVAAIEETHAEKPAQTGESHMAAHQRQALNEAVEQNHHVVSLLATNVLNVAAFEYMDMLWFMMEPSSPYSIPSLSSPAPDLFGTFNQYNIAQGGSAYAMSLPKHLPLKMKGTGGGLEWKLIMGDKVREGASVKVVRLEDKQARLNGGKILLPIKGAGGILDFEDPITGRIIKVVTVDSATEFAGEHQSFVDFELLRSPIGVAILPKVDDLIVEKSQHGIEISRPSGLALSPSSKIEEARIFLTRKQDEHDAPPVPHGGDAHSAADGHGKKDDQGSILKFNQWKMKSADELRHRKNILLAGLHDKSDARRVEDLLALGKMHLAHGRGAEALGFFEYARQELPALEKSPEFLTLRGVANAQDWKNEAALIDFLSIDLDMIEEARYWKSFVLADLGDWEQAVKTLPKHYRPLQNYPANIANSLALVLAEVNLRDGRVAEAEELLAIIEHNKAELPDPIMAYLKYLSGEAARQKGDKERAQEIWEELTQDKDDLFRTKSGLALAVLLDQNNKITNKDMIDRLERLRYAWRGDELEAQVNYWLGQAYFKDKNFIKGLSIMREAAAIAGDTLLASRITKDMGQVFVDLYLGHDLKNVSPIDAVALYEQFSELTPVGPKGDKMVQMLAEHLVNADLLSKATKLLEYQVDHRLSGEDKMRVAIRLAAINLLDKQPQKAINALSKAEAVLVLLSNKDEVRKRAHEIALLRVRAYLQNKQYDTALSLLEKMPESKDVHRLRADIAWQAGYWDEAAASLNDVLIDENLVPDSALTEEQASLILNRSIALSLDNDRIALANMREKYLSPIAKSGFKANQFEVITRPRGSSALADRETLMSAVSEVDLFKDFLESYRKEQ